MSERDDDLLRQLGELARAEAHDEAQRGLGALVRGELTSSEVARLEARAVAGKIACARIAAYRPLSADAKARLVARLQVTARERKTDSVMDEPEPEPEPEPERARRASWKRRDVLAISVALAASVTLGVLTQWRRHAQPAPLPAYALEVDDGWAQQRAEAHAPGRPVLISRATQLELLLRPSVPVADEPFDGVDARVFAMTVAGIVVPWPAQVARAGQGALRVQLSEQPPRAIVAGHVLVGPAATLARLHRYDPEQLPPGVQLLTFPVFDAHLDLPYSKLPRKRAAKDEE